MKKLDKTELEQKAFDFCLREYNNYEITKDKCNHTDEQVSEWLRKLCPEITSPLAKEIIFDRNLEEYLYNTEEGFAFMFNLRNKLNDTNSLRIISESTMNIQAKLSDSINSKEMRVIPYWVASNYIPVIDTVLRDYVTEPEMNYIKFITWYITTSMLCNVKPLFDKKTTKFAMEYISGTMTNADKWLVSALWYRAATTVEHTGMSNVIAAMLGKR